MSKYFKILVLAMLVVGLMAGSAFAISAITRAGVANTTVAKEIIDPSAGYTHVGAGDLRFTVDVGIANTKKMIVSLTNGTFTNINNLKMCTVAGAAVTANLTSTTTDKRRAEFTANAAIAAGTIHVTDAAACAVAPAGISIGIDAGASSVTATIATDDAAETTPQLSNATFYSSQQQFGVNATTGIVTDTIDVEKNLLKFDPTTTASASETISHWDGGNGLITALKGASSGPTLAAVSYPNVNVNFKVTGNMVGISTMKLIDTKGTLVTTDDVDVATLTVNTDKTEATGSMKLTDLLLKTVAIKATIDGTTTLEDRKFSIEAKLSTADDVKVSTTLINADATADALIAGAVKIACGKEQLVWDINGLQFVAPYVRQDSNVTSVIRVENVANKDSKVWLFVNSGGTWKLVKTSDLTKGSALVTTGQALIDAAATAGVTLNGTTGFAAWGVVKGTAMDNKNITVYGSQQLIDGSFRPLPIQVHFAGWYE